MQAKTTDAPKDVMALLVDNLKQGKPLLQDAVLLRGTRLPDQTSSSYSTEVMHGSLLPQVAASYTNNWREETTFIGAYKVDREQTRFFKDFGMEQHLEGKPVPSMSVKEAERFLEPYVRAIADAPDSRTRGRAEERLESAVKQNLYEAGIPTRTAAREPNRPDEMFIYRGRPDVSIRQAVTMQMKRMGPEGEAHAKQVMSREHRNPVTRQLHQLAIQRTPTTGRAMTVLKEIVQRDFGDKMMAAHGSKPLNKMMDAVAKEPLTADQERLGRFAKALSEGENHPNPAVSGKANAIMAELAKLDGSKATYQDVAKVSAAVSAKFSANESGTSKQAEPTKATAPRAAAALDR